MTQTDSRQMTPEHKEALALGRQHGRIVKQYLTALDQHKPKRGRQVTAEAIKERLNKIEKDLPFAEPIERLRLVQDRMDLLNRLERAETSDTIAELEKQFIQVAKPYAERKRISYDALREVGVPPTVLKEAGITPR